ncbi:HAD-like domain-containing protein [Penicillium canescens]|nr:HAD-like domain-containing protein [Penicillium canescens]KAJ6040799.1 HAD-like domain-containing protein [Penicillium canescens]KAJ6066848.1 HAD-like domain-containing protein [Penicillium canescens]KAJ6101348.1 HAD-like domain-containing protein [Penicillium canescens]KAJ6173806.1 HAD-like domain-containing protein [Penicillium canescens]
MDPPKRIKCEEATILVDLGGIFVHPEMESKVATRDSTISLRRIMSTSVWMTYEAGKLSDEECFSQLAKEYHFQASDLAAMIQNLRETITYDQVAASIFREIKRLGARIFLVSNISKEDYAALRNRLDNGFWSIFDGVFTSSTLGVRKPNLRFYRQVLRATRALPYRTFFVDDSPENVLAALSVGMKGTFDTTKLYRTITNFVGDPVERGLAFLRRQRGLFPTTTQYGEPISENYAPLLILEALKDPNLVNLKASPRLWNFFAGEPKYTSDAYPDDLDTTSLGLLVMPPDLTVVHSILDEMHDFIDEDGDVQTYFDKSRPRVDAIVALNVLTLFYKYGRGHEIPFTMEWIYNILINRAYVQGTRYYPNGEWFLYCLTRLLRESSDPTLKEILEAPLRARVAEKVGSTGDACCLGMRVLACNYFGIDNSVDRQKLVDIQQEDGGWEASCMYLVPGAKREVGNRGASTAFAVKALENWSRW